MRAGIAQSVEQLIRNEKVGGSIPLSGTNRINDLAQLLSWAFSLGLHGGYVSPQPTHSPACFAAALAGAPRRLCELAVNGPVAFTSVHLHRTTAASTPHRLGHKSFAVHCLFTLLGSAFYTVLVHRLAIYAPRFLPTIGHPHAVALHFTHCCQLVAGLAPAGVRPCWAHNDKPGTVAGSGGGAGAEIRSPAACRRPGRRDRAHSRRAGMASALLAMPPPSRHAMDAASRRPARPARLGACGRRDSWSAGCAPLDQVPGGRVHRGLSKPSGSARRTASTNRHHQQNQICPHLSARCCVATFGRCPSNCKVQAHPAWAAVNRV